MRINDVYKEAERRVPDVSAAVKQRIATTDGAKKAKKKFVINKFFAVGAAVAAFALVFAIVIPAVLTPQTPPVQASCYEVVIDVNPTVKLTVDKNDKVIAQNGLNEDGVKLLFGLNYKGLNVDEAAGAICSEMQKIGVLSGGKTVRISVYDGKTHKVLDSRQTEVASAIQKILQTQDISTVFLTDDELDKIEDYYKEHRVDEYVKTAVEDLKNRLKQLIEVKKNKINSLIKAVDESDDNSQTIVLPQSVKDRITEFCKEYNFELEFDLNGTIKRKDLDEFKEELEESLEDLDECLEEIEESDDDYGERLADLLETLKEDIFNKED